MADAAELKIDSNITAQQMAETIFGAGVKVVKASYTGAQTAAGLYSGAEATMPGVAPSDSGLILSTGRAADITNSAGDPNISSATSTAQGTAGDAQLTKIAGAQTYDAAVLHAAFVPDGDMLSMQLVFASEEYLEYVGSGFNDVCAIWVNGTQAELTVGSGDITIDNINDKSNAGFYVDNPANTDRFNTEMDGFTVTLTLKVPVLRGQVNTIKIAIADAGDRVYDSNLMIAADSVQVAVIAADDSVTIGGSDTTTFDPLANDTATLGKLVITEINGQPVVAGSTIKLPSGEWVTLNKDGTLTVVSHGPPGQTQLSYTVSNGLGTTDVGVITVNTIPCFTAGTRIDTPSGPRPVESLRPGDLVLTRDHGPQPLRWTGQRAVPGLGRFAPVRIAAGTFGPHGRLVVSQQHRILLTGPAAELLTGQAEALAPALHLVDGRAVRLAATARRVVYIHLLFDRHEILIANGLCTESFFPGEGGLDALGARARAEILALFPALGRGGYGPTARPVLHRHETQVLRAAWLVQS